MFGECASWFRLSLFDGSSPKIEPRRTRREQINRFCFVFFVVRSLALDRKCQHPCHSSCAMLCALSPREAINSNRSLSVALFVFFVVQAFALRRIVAKD
jgi:hypothetical protein